MEFTLDQPVFLSRPADAQQIWWCDVTLPFRVSSHGVAQTNWSAEGIVIEDSSGNVDYTGAAKTVANQRIVYRSGRSVDPRLPWHISLDFSIDSDWSSTNLCQIEVDRAPAASSLAIVTNSSGTLIRTHSYLATNFNGVPVTACVVPMGQLVELAVEIPTNRPDLRLTYIKVTDQAGKDLVDEGGSWNQYTFSRLLAPSVFNSSGERVEVTFAIAKSYHMEFYCKPKAPDPLLRAAKPP